MRSTTAIVVLVLLCGCAPDTPDTGAAGGVALYFGTPTAKSTRALEVGGGTVLALSETRAAVSDGDGAQVWLIDLAGAKVERKIALGAGSAPGRMAVDANGTLYVALRGTGEVAAIDSQRGSVRSTTKVCGDPRGLAWDGTANSMRIACGDGTFGSIAVDGTLSTQRVSPDLRDVLVTPDGLMATSFRSAQLVDVQGRGTKALDPGALAGGAANTTVSLTPHVAWRAVVGGDGSLIIAHQLSVDGPVENLRPAAPKGAPPTTGAYSSSAVPQACAPPCSSPVVRSALTVVSPGGAGQLIELAGALPVDVAVSPDGKEAAVALYGAGLVDRVPLDGSTGVGLQSCVPQPQPGAVAVTDPTGVAYTPKGTLIIHSAHPSTVTIVSTDGTKAVELGAGLEDPGQTFFHLTVNGLACASCHPEGRDDGHVWNVAGNARRTPSLAGGLLATAPFHWEGNLPDIDALVEDTFVKRMGGDKPSAKTVIALGTWLDGIPKPAPTSTLPAKQIYRGQLVFEGAGCTGCHSGATMTSSLTLDVGTGGSFQVPSLRGVGARAPYLHDGRAQTLRQRFDPTMGGGDRHGLTSQLDDEQLGLLIGYLESL
jgi:DNA-binding beta-propeller fold protein YncE